MIDLNQLQSDFQSPVIASVKQNRKTRIETRTTKQIWYQDYTVPESYVGVKQTVHSKPPNYEVGDTISAINAVQQELFGLDVRPKVFDNSSKSWVLIDSGSCVSCLPPTKSDILDPTFKLKSVNGGIIDTYGTKEICLQLGRKLYRIQAVIAHARAQGKGR